MAICRYFHKPDLFFTITTNPKQPEIVQSLFSGQIATDCPNIISWVFEWKKKALLKLIDSSFFGTPVAHVYTIEFQKRGLPHIHLFTFLQSQDCTQDFYYINFMISAQLSDPQLQLLLYAKVTKYMLYSPCSADNPQAKCMVNRQCSKCFSKDYRERIDWAEDSYLLYTRPNNGLVFEHNRARFTNQYVVPYFLNFFFSLIVISMQRSLLDQELSSI